MKRKTPLSDSLDPVTKEFLEKHRHESAIDVFDVSQIMWTLVFCEIALFFAISDGFAFLTIVSFACALLYIACIVFRLAAVWLAIVHRPELSVSSAQLATMGDSQLPVYTILVPLYREANVATSIVRYISRLDYPRECLDVKLLLEEDDVETILAISRLHLEAPYEIVVIPHSLPKTKPKACNWGLEKSRGQFVVIFDAEDRPEPDQLKKAVWAFAASVDNVACLQAKLNYYNPRQNLLTRWFAIEYTMWFDFLLPGLQLMGAPIPLGGTSNHFRTEVLRKLGGWDPFNVTEDCDLGIRLTKHGYVTQILDSTTWEEANSNVQNWIRQRSRWIKGFMQTHLVHFRHPIELVRSMGLWRTLCFFLSVGGLSLTQVLNLLFWSVGIIYVSLLGIDLIQGRELAVVIGGHRDEYRLAWKLLYWGSGENRFWAPFSLVFFTLGITLFLTNGLFILINCLACHRRKNSDMLTSAMISPVYWILISFAAWKGLVQLFTNPFYWEKTIHGLDKVDEALPELEMKVAD